MIQAAQASQVSKQIFQELDQFLNRLEKEVYENIYEYKEENDQWPTFRELADYMDVDKNTIQPRISELKKRMFICQAGKRQCNISEHSTCVSTWKTVITPNPPSENKVENKEPLLIDENSGKVIAE